MLARYIQWPYGLGERRKQLGELCEAIHAQLDTIDDDCDDYRQLFASLTCLMLALEAKPISRSLCVKALRHLQTLSADTARKGVGAH